MAQKPFVSGHSAAFTNMSEVCVVEVWLVRALPCARNFTQDNSTSQNGMARPGRTVVTTRHKFQPGVLMLGWRAVCPFLQPVGMHKDRWGYSGI